MPAKSSATTESQRARTASLLLAGAFLPPETKLPDGEHVDRVDARAYRHGALGERPVVRLTPETLAEGEATVLEFLGFEVKKPTVVKGVALRRRQTLGFPAWALVHDPKKARFALEVMKDFRKEARRAKSKPGFAKEGIDAIAKKLARSVPHFLPSFYEEAGRVFIDVGNQTYASQCFGKAREVEQVHNLKVVEEERKAVFLEFALAGAVTIKALSAYAKDLEAAHGAAEAYKHYREIAIRRTLGGLPPWAGMAKDMQRLAKGAGCDSEREDETLLEELLPASSLNRAPAGFWDAYQGALGRLVARTEAAREALLALAPEPSGSRGGDDDEEGSFFDRWLKLLEEVGVITPWLEGSAGKNEGKASGWFSRMLDLGGKNRWPTAAPDSIFALLRRMAPALKADGTPLRTFMEDRWGESNELEVDLTDLALELGIAVADPPKELSMDLDDWARAASGSKERPRDPGYLAKDPRFAEPFQKAVGDACGGERFETAARGKSAMAEARRRWLLELCEPTEGALPALAQKLERIKEATTVHTFKEFPEALPKLGKLSEGLEARLARSLRGGVAAELVWPAFEAAYRALDPDGKGELKCSGAFPYCVVTDEKKAIVVGPKGKLLEHDLKIPKGGSLRWLQFVDGQLLCVFYDKSYDAKAYWSGSPKHVFEPDLEGYPSLDLDGVQLPLAGGGALFDGKPVRSGDTKLTDAGDSVLCDGKTHWRRVERGEQEVLEEFDPLSGEKGRESMPRFLEEFVKEGYKLALSDARLIPAPEGLKASPLGIKDGLLGWRERWELPEAEEDPSKRHEAEGIDGRRYLGELGGGERSIDALLELPGDSRLRPVDVDGYVSDDLDGYAVAIWDPDGKYAAARWEKGSAYAGGVPLVLPLHWWHLYQPRDEKGSAALRELADAVAAELCAAAKEDLAAEAKKKDADDEKKRELKKTEAAVKKLLPAVSDKALRAGVAEVAAEAARLLAEHEELAKLRDPENPEATMVAEEGDEDRFEKAQELLGLVVDDNYGLGGALNQLRAVGSYFAQGAPSKVPENGFGWDELCGKLGSVVYLAAAPGTGAEEREAALAFLEGWIESPFLAPAAGTMRVYSCELKRKKIPFPIQDDGSWSAWGVGEHEGNRYFLTGLDIDDDDDQSGVSVIEQAATAGKFKLLPSVKLSEEEKLEPGWATPERLRAFIDAIRTRGGWSYERPMGEALAARTGMAYAEAALLLSGMPGFRTYKKNFLPTPLRETLGLKVGDADSARDSLRRIGEKKLRAILDGALPEDPEAIYTPFGAGPDDDGSFVARLAESYTNVMGKRIALDPALVAQLGRDLNFLWVKPAEVLGPLSDPKKAPALNKDGSWKLEEYGVSSDGKGGEIFDSDALRQLGTYFLYLASELPAGHPLGKQLPEVQTRLAKRLASPGLLLDAGSVYSSNKKKAEALVESVGGKTFKAKGSKKALGRDNGALLALLEDDDESPSVYLAFRPSKVKDWELVRKLASQDEDGESDSTITLAELLQGAEVKAIAAALKDGGLAEGSYPSNPLVSAPKTVTEVQKKLKLSEDAAVYYLQLLALSAPTTARVQLWNGWTPSRVKKAGDELKKAKLCVEAKRARAGRAHFLPGGWEALSAPNLPIETWKLSLYGVTRARKGEKIQVPLQRILPLKPLPALFAEAWARVQKGDKPRYEEVR